MTDDPSHLRAVPVTGGPAQRAEPVVEHVPAEVREAARRAFAERDRHARVMALEYDSLLVPGATDPERRLVFVEPGGAEVTAVVRRASPGDRVEVDITLRGCSLVEVQCGETTLAVAVDAPGPAHVGPAPHGLFSAVLQDDAGRRLRTAWVRV